MDVERDVSVSKETYVCEKRERRSSVRSLRQHRGRFGQLGSTHTSKEIHVCKKETYRWKRDICM